jgi:sporulation protein YlmC with PRC-barrel domain
MRKKVAMTDKTTGPWTGRDVVDTTGEKIGSVRDIVYDDITSQPKWLVIKTGLFGGKKVYVPAGDVHMAEDRLMVPYTEDRVKESPRVGKDEVLSREQERELHLYYGLDFPEPTVTTPRGETETISRGPEVAPPGDREPMETGRRRR